MMVLVINEPPRKDRSRVAAELIILILEIIDVISGEEYAVVKTATPILHFQESGGWSPITDPPPHCLIQKLLELTNKMTELLTGEVTAGNVGGHSSGGLWLMTGYCVVRFL
ncbi:hypothetical protein GDO78_014569 [Eleutherodactylus coqui]|uniref:Uncharacterized protein n=1 Tax=Eleutherodactylus coqui TaxID=57060 RepID=A0A8J6EEN8_ELECQ|nr:hypothetical protein GDO78_014569 [Eleutherodactylus coqui]